ncbi:hypothetical protein FRC12_006334 [Ceratobasidium sp. 428]|nr:hypothetical protein FRC12_006334 [Ceratobasidium sp. 428]
MVFSTPTQTLRRELAENNKVNDDLREVEAKLREASDSVASFKSRAAIQVFKTGIDGCIRTTSTALDLSTRLYANRNQLLNVILRPYTAVDTMILEHAIEEDLASLILNISDLVAPIQMAVTQATALSNHAEPSSAFHRWSVEVCAALTVVSAIVGGLAYAYGHKALYSGSFVTMGVGFVLTAGAYYLRPRWRTVTRATDKARQIIDKMPPSLLQTVAL